MLIIGFLLGVLFRSLYDVGIALTALLCVIGLTVLAASRREWALLIALLLFSAGGGMVRTELAERALVPHPELEEGVTITAHGTVVREPDVRNGHTVLVLALDHIDEAPATVWVRTSVLPYPVFSYGDRVTVKGVVHVPTTFDTDSGRVFNYPAYLKKEGVQYEMRYPHIEKVGEGGGNPAVRGLLYLKHTWLDAISRVVPEPGAALLGGLVVGAKQSLGEVWLARFRETGIIHIVVLSGFNLTVVADGITKITGFLPRSGAYGLGLLGILGFALMTGASATVVRASIMAALALTARNIGRPFAIVRALSVAGFLMVLHNPFILAFDPGFQLSFVATLGLVLGSPLVKARLGWVPELWQMREIVAATIATQIAVLPLLLYQVGQLSLAALPVNVLVLPLVPFTMGIGALTGVLALVSDTLALPFALVTHSILSYMFTVVDLFARIPYAAVPIPPVPFVLVVCTYALFAYGLYRNSVRDETLFLMRVPQNESQPRSS